MMLTKMLDHMNRNHKEGKATRHRSNVGEWPTNFGQECSGPLNVALPPLPSETDEAKIETTTSVSFTALLFDNNSTSFDAQALTLVSKEKVENWPQDQDQEADPMSSSFERKSVGKEQQQPKKSPNNKKRMFIRDSDLMVPDLELMAPATTTTEKSHPLIAVDSKRDMKDIAKRLTESLPSESKGSSRVKPRASESPSFLESKSRNLRSHHSRSRTPTPTNDRSGSQLRHGRRRHAYNSENVTPPKDNQMDTKTESSSSGRGATRSQDRANRSPNRCRSRSRVRRIEARLLDDTTTQGANGSPTSALTTVGDVNLTEHFNRNATTCRESSSNSTLGCNDISQPSSFSSSPRSVMVAMRRPGAAEENRRRWVSRGCGRVNSPTIPMGSPKSTARRTRERNHLLRNTISTGTH